MKRILILLSMVLSFQVAMCQRSTRDTTTIQNNFGKYHSEFRSGLYTFIGGTAVTAIGISIKPYKLPDATPARVQADKDFKDGFVIVGVAAELVGAVIMIDSSVRIHGIKRRLRVSPQSVSLNF